MTRLCGYSLGGEQKCTHRITDGRTDCGRHRPGATLLVSGDLPRADRRGCRMVEESPGSWRCLVHDVEQGWDVAESLGAQLPCVIPLDFPERCELAKRTPIDPRMARLLARDPHPAVRTWLQQNATLPPDVLSVLHEALPLEARASSSTIPISELLGLSRHSDMKVSAAALQNLRMPAEELVRQAADPSPAKKSAIAHNPNAPAKVLCRLASDPESLVRGAVAGNKSMPSEAGRLLVEDPDVQVRTHLAWNPEVPEEVLNQLVSDSDIEVVRTLARNPSLPAIAAQRLMGHRDSEVRLWLARNSQAPISVLVGLSTDPRAEVRQAVASHRYAPAELLLNMLQDKDARVRELAAQPTADHPQ